MNNTVSRKQAREIALHLVFEMGFGAFEAENVMTDRLGEEIMQSISGDIALYAGKLDEAQTKYIVSAVKGVAEQREDLDAYIENNAKGWKRSGVSSIPIAIQRLPTDHMYYVEDDPVGAAVT